MENQKPMYFISGVSMKNPGNRLQKAIWSKGNSYRNFVVESPEEFYMAMTKLIVKLNEEHPRCTPERVGWYEYDKTTIFISFGQVWRFTVNAIVAKWGAKDGYQPYLFIKGGSHE
jgi:hypothetical protein